ncbi:MAG: adenine phosphoribosyltransferase [archaeon]
MNEEELKEKIRNVPDFPKKGIVFRDITTLLQDPKALKLSIREMLKRVEGKKIDVVIGAESRGFIFGSLIAYELGVPFVPVRKPGKLPFKKIKKEFQTEYSTDSLEIHVDAIKKGDNVLIADDLLATGGTSKAICELVEELEGNVVALIFLIELSFLKGREKIKDYEVFSLVDYESE